MTLLAQRADSQLERWESVVRVFQKRFHAPFSVEIDNHQGVVLRNEPARIRFTCGEEADSRVKTQNELMGFLSVGEKRALYLLQVIFDIERIKIEAKGSTQRYLIIADDVGRFI